MKLIGDYKKVLLVGAIALGSAGVGAVALHPKATADFDLPGLNQQVQNHEARITNTENDVKALQDNTNTPAATNAVPVPVVTAQPTSTTATQTPTPAPVPAPTPTEVSRTQVEYVCGVNSYLMQATITYSDGTQKTIPAVVPDNCTVLTTDGTPI